MLAPYWSGHPEVFGDLLSDLERDHRIVTWDARGTGDSTRTGPYDVGTDSDDLEAVLEHVGAATSVIGVANGCNVVARAAARRRDLIGSVIAFGAGPFARMDFAGSEAMVGSDSVVAAFLEMLRRDYRGALRTVLTATNPQMSEDELRERIDLQTAYCPQEAAVARVQEWADDDPTESAAALWDRLWILSAPAVAGPWLPPLAERLEIIRTVMPEARVETVSDDVGPVSRPDLVAASVRRVTLPLESGDREEQSREWTGCRGTPAVGIPSQPFLVWRSRPCLRDREHRLNLRGEHEIALDLQLAAHEHHRTAGVTGDELQEVHPAQLQSDPWVRLRFWARRAGAVGDDRLPVILTAIRTPGDLPMDHRGPRAPAARVLLHALEDLADDLIAERALHRLAELVVRRLPDRPRKLRWIDRGGVTPSRCSPLLLSR